MYNVYVYVYVYISAADFFIYIYIYCYIWQTCLRRIGSYGQSLEGLLGRCVKISAIWLETMSFKHSKISDPGI